MTCKECGTEIESGVQNCPSCDTAVKDVTKLNSTFSIISLVCGILAFLEGGTFSTIGAIVTAIIVLVKDRKNVFAWIGLALGSYCFLVQLAAYLFLIVFFVLYFVFAFLVILTGFSIN